MDLEIFENCTVNTSKNRSLVFTATILIICCISLWNRKEHKKCTKNYRKLIIEGGGPNQLNCCNSNKCP